MVTEFSEDYYKQFELLQNIESQKIHFETDDYIKQYQVFRIDKKPHTYSDFADGTHEILANGQTDFVDSLIPNKKYYYTFRSEDHHGYISNPTVIYEIEIVEDSGAVYPIIKVVDFFPFLKKEKTLRLVQNMILFFL